MPCGPPVQLVLISGDCVCPLVYVHSCVCMCEHVWVLCVCLCVFVHVYASVYVCLCVYPEAKAWQSATFVLVTEGLRDRFSVSPRVMLSVVTSVHCYFFNFKVVCLYFFCCALFKSLRGNESCLNQSAEGT